MKTALVLTLAVIAIGIFSIWFFPLQGQTLYGLVLGTGSFITALLLGFITHLLANEERI